MRKIFSFIVMLSVVAAAANAAAQTPKWHSNTGAEVDVAAIIWPAYQNDPRWKELGIFDHGNGEWQNVYEAAPKFDGHNEPRKPLWGYVRDDDSAEVARQIDAALAAGVNVFIYDWYWYGGRPFLEDALNKGFLKAPNSQRMKFFLMWANHHVKGLWNNKMPLSEKNKIIWRADVSEGEFCDVLIPRFVSYFKQPNHYLIDGKPVFAVYEFKTFVDGVGGEEVAKRCIAKLDKACKDAGFAGVHLMLFNYVPAEVKSAGISGEKAAMEYFGITSITAYNWNFRTWKTMQKNKLTYEQWFDMAQKIWNDVRDETGGNFYPNVTVGWDTNSRFPKDVFTPVIYGSNPVSFKRALIAAKEWTVKNCKNRLITINSWNEWTEGSYLMPDEEFGYGYLNACAEVFGGKNCKNEPEKREK